MKLNPLTKYANLNFSNTYRPQPLVMTPLVGTLHSTKVPM